MMAGDNQQGRSGGGGGGGGGGRRDVPLNVPAAKEAEQYSLEMTPDDLDRQHDPREAQQVNRVILSGQGTAQNDRSTGGKAGPGGTPGR